MEIYVLCIHRLPRFCGFENHVDRLINFQSVSKRFRLAAPRMITRDWSVLYYAHRFNS